MKLRGALMLLAMVAGSVVAQEKALDTTYSGGLIFATGGASPTTERMRITQGGWVGIGTDTPSSSLHLSGPTWTVLTIGALSNDPSLQLTSDASNNINDWTMRMDVSDGDKLQWRYDNAGLMTLNVSGSLGIGSTAPKAKLDVIGSISASDAIQVGSSSLTCNSGLKGALRYSNVSGTIEYCQGTAWMNVAAADGGVYASYYSNAAQSIPNNAFTTVTAFGTKKFDSGSSFNGTTFTAPVAGVYNFHAQTGFVNIGGGSILGSRFLKNGATVFGYNSTRSTNTAADVNVASDALIQLAANDTVVFQAWQVTGSAQNTRNDASSFFDVYGPVDANAGSGSGGGGATPAGNTGDIQFNDGSNLAADTGQLFWDAASNRLGIGTSSPGAPLDVSGTGLFLRLRSAQYGTIYAGADAYEPWFGTQTNNDIRLITSSTERVRIEASGNVGIGTAAPSAKLDVQGQISSTGGITAGFASSYGQFRAVGAGYGTILRNDGVNTYLLLTNAGDPFGSWNSLRPFQLVNATGNLNLGNGALYVNHGGNVGIGTLSANAELTFGSDAADINLDTADAADIGYLGLSGGGASSWSRGASIFLFGNENANTGNLELQAGNVAGGDIVFSAGGAERARMAYGGNVGIGTGAPAAKLQVQGTISASDAVQVGASSLTCNSGIKGAMRYSNTSSTIEYCQGTAWVSMGPSATDVPAFSVHKNGTSQNVSTNNWVKVTWSAEKFDTNNNFASDKFTPTVSGKYLFTAGALCMATNGYCAMAIFKNGVMYAQSNNGMTGGGYNISGLVSVLVDMNGSTDYVEAYVYSGTATLSGSADQTYFMGTLIASGNGTMGTSGVAGSSGDIQFNDGGALGADTGQLYWDGTNDRLGIGTNNPTAAGLGWTGWGNPKVGLVSAGDGLNIRIDGPNNPLNLWKKTGTAGGLVSFSFGTTRSDVGNIYTNGTTTSYNTTSDGRLKTHIRPTALGLDEVMRIEVDDFVFRDDPSETVETGFIAQELMKIFPGAVTTNGDDGVTPLKAGKGAWSVDYGRLTPLLVKSVQELKAANDNIRAENALLRKELEAIKRRVGM